MKACNIFKKKDIKRTSEASALVQGPQVGKMVQISMIGFKTSFVSNERAACVNVVLHCFHLCHAVFVHLCAIKGFVDSCSVRTVGCSCLVMVTFDSTGRP